MRHSLPDLRLPALVNGEKTFLNLSSFQGLWTVMCYLPRLSLTEAYILEQQSGQFIEEGAEFVGVILHACPFDEPWMKAFGKFSYTLLADPLGQASYIFGNPKSISLAKSQSLISDAEGIFRYQLIHELNRRGLAYVLEMLRHHKMKLEQRSYDLTYTPSSYHT